MTIDKPALTKLWQQAFGDPPEFIDGFFRTGFAPERCRFLEKGGKVAAALYWFDCLWDGKKVAYIYAVATDRDFRGQGLCRQLMTDTHLHLQQQGYAGAVLVPGDAGLFAMYEKLGYRGFCPMAQKTVPAGGQPVALQSVTPAQYGSLAAAKTPAGGVLHTQAALDFYGTYGGFYAFAGGVFCAAREGETLYVQEYLGDPTALPGIGAALGAKEIRARLPGGDKPFAMYQSFTDEALPQYFAMALD